MRRRQSRKEREQNSEERKEAWKSGGKFLTKWKNGARDTLERGEKSEGEEARD